MICFCSACGHATHRIVPPGDSRTRDVCASAACALVHYENPKIVAGTLPVWQGNILLCKRAIEPRLGYWTLPAGFMEINETCEQGAVRETWEEAAAKVHVRSLLSVLDVPHASQVHMFYLADLIDGQFAPGTESLDVQLFAPENIPWGEIAFKTVTKTLRHYLSDTENPKQLTGVVTYTPKTM
jgi:ADP-ribose pyrophosphatase YjhB (NUDIX family)